MKTIKIQDNLWRDLSREKLDEQLTKIEDVIRANSLLAKKFTNEKDFCIWIRKNYRVLGFDRIIKENVRGASPDFIFEKEGKNIKVEVETLSSHFLIHKHKPSDFDLVICLVEDKKIPVKTIVVNGLEFDDPNSYFTNIRISSEDKKRLSKYKIHNNQSFQEVIKILLDEKEVKNERNKNTRA